MKPIAFAALLLRGPKTSQSNGVCKSYYGNHHENRIIRYLIIPWDNLTASRLLKASGSTMPIVRHNHTCRDGVQSNTIFCDNQSAIAQIVNQKNHERSKHIDIRYHFVRDLAADSLVKLIYLPTEDMIADIMTKPLARERHWCHCQNLGLLDENEEERSK